MFIALLFMTLTIQCFLPIYAEKIEPKLVNEKYVKDVELIISVKGEGRFVFNYTATTFEPWSNNFTFRAGFIMADGQLFEMQFKACEALSHQWIVEILNAYSNVELQCPLKPMIYKFKNVEFPPKNFPIKLPKGEFRIIFEAFLTDTKEAIVEFEFKVAI